MSLTKEKPQEISKEVVAARIKEARENSQLTQDQLAARIGLDRSAVGKIEIAARKVSGLELEKIAQVFGRNPKEFLSPEPLKQDPLMLFRSITNESSPEHQKQISDIIAMLREARFLEGYLAEEKPPLPDVYGFGQPRSFNEAVRQGQLMAQLERERLGLGFAPILDIALLISKQGIRAATVPLIDEVSGIFIHDDELGAAVLVNQFNSSVRMRFSYAHEYAHALFDRREPSKPSTRENASELLEKRANTFAGEFLVPEAGIWAILDRMHKGEPSRFHRALFDAASGLMQDHEGRSNPEIHRVTIREVAALAHDFRVSVDVIIYRLDDVGAIRKPEKQALLDQRDIAKRLIRICALYDADATDKEDEDDRYLRWQLLFLAMEALRREKISTGRFRHVCVMCGYQADELLPIVQAMHEE